MTLSTKAQEVMMIVKDINILEEKLNHLLEPVTINSDPVIDEVMKPDILHHNLNKRIRKPCCGSGNWKHKSDCPAKKNEVGQTTSSPTNIDDDTEPEPEELRCGDCEHRFQGVLLDAVCSKCGSNTIYRFYE